ncbi:MAG: N-acetyltransferase [Balneolaceae bacterium]|nr:N-acetyltransferase [Balneolaceae bacterium]
MIKNLNIHTESSVDEQAIRELIIKAFDNHPFSNQTEHLIVDELRKQDSLSISLVAEIESEIIGHIAFSEILVNEQHVNWYGLAPVSVHPKYQNRGVGSALIKAGLEQLKELGANGCVLVGEPDYYTRFGFNHQDKLTFEGVPLQYFLALSFEEEIPEGEVSYHSAFTKHG